MGKCIYVCLDVCLDVCMNGWMDGWMDVEMNAWIDECTFFVHVNVSLYASLYA